MKEYRPPPALAPYVECFWSRGAFEPDEIDGIHRVLPDGCLDVIFSERRAVVVGAMTRPLLIPARGVETLLGVRFLPGMATAFLKVPASALTDSTAPLEAIWSDGRRVFDLIGSSLGSSAAVESLAVVLLERLGAVRAIPADVHAAVGLIVTHGGRFDVSDVASSVGVTRQHLARRFADYVGVTPKTLSRVMRMRTTLRAARSTRARINWAAVAADLGYSDQSHLVAEFRRLTGLSPARWVRHR